MQVVFSTAEHLSIVEEQYRSARATHIHKSSGGRTVSVRRGVMQRCRRCASWEAEGTRLVISASRWATGAGEQEDRGRVGFVSGVVRKEVCSRGVRDKRDSAFVRAFVLGKGREDIALFT